MEFADRLRAFFQRRRTNFRLIKGVLEGQPAGRQFLADLEEFCCANVTTARGDSAHDMAIREGRRQVWLRITRAINLTADEQLLIVSQKDRP